MVSFSLSLYHSDPPPGLTKLQPATGDKQAAEPQARRQRSEGRHGQPGNRAERRQGPQGFHLEKHGGSNRGTRIRFGGKRGKMHTKMWESKSVCHWDGNSSPPTPHARFSREPAGFLCPKCLIGLGMQFCSLWKAPLQLSHILSLFHSPQAAFWKYLHEGIHRES